MNCYCNDETKTASYNCVICNTPETLFMSRPQREFACHRKITMICGMPEYVCYDCKKLGWWSSAGSGGGTYHRNELTGEEKTVGQFIKKND